MRYFHYEKETIAMDCINQIEISWRDKEEHEMHDEYFDDYAEAFVFLCNVISSDDKTIEFVSFPSRTNINLVPVEVNEKTERK